MWWLCIVVKLVLSSCKRQVIPSFDVQCTSMRRWRCVTYLFQVQNIIQCLSQNMWGSNSTLPWPIEWLHKTTGISLLKWPDSLCMEHLLIEDNIATLCSVVLLVACWKVPAQKGLLTNYVFSYYNVKVLYNF